MKQDRITRSGAIRPRYSNEGTTDQGGLPGGNSGSSSTGSGVFDWGSFINNLVGTAGGVLTSIFGKGDKYVVSAQNQIIEQQRKTTTILWAVIGLMAVLGVVLVIRKNR